MFLYEMARKVNKRLKAEKKRRMGLIASPVRRIERVYPISSERVCAMTFDDGPDALPPEPDMSGGAPLTMHLVDTLRSYGATATFDIIGDTSENYPDTRGEKDTFYWGGDKFDHYPDFEKDAFAGAKNCPELVKYILDSGFELANHGYRHLIFGTSRVYSKRVPFSSVEEVLEDLGRLHSLIKDNYGFEMKLSRPPHYIDGIAGGFNSYDVYELMGYNYMAASFDGGGWMPQKGTFEEDVKGMVEPMRRALEADENALNGQIIFQKDGCNMSRMTPIAAALPLQLELLREYGYRVCSVGELMSMSPFEDLSDKDECFEAVRKLDRLGLAVGCRNNTFNPDRTLTFGELCMMLCPASEREERVKARIAGEKSLGGFDLSSPYAGALSWAAKSGVLKKPGAGASHDDIVRLADARGLEVRLVEKPDYTRREAACAISEAVPGNNETGK